MRKIKEIIFSENGMKAVNTLFFLSMLFYRSGLLFVAYIVWICYLVYCIKNTESRGNKVIYSLFAGLAVVMIGVNLYGLINSQHKIRKLNVDEVTEFVIISPPSKKTVTQKNDIQDFVKLFNNLEKRPNFSVGNASGWSKRVIISTNTYTYDIIFSGKCITINHTKYILDSSIDSELAEYYNSLDYPEMNYN